MGVFHYPVIHTVGCVGRKQHQVFKRCSVTVIPAVTEVSTAMLPQELLSFPQHLLGRPKPHGCCSKIRTPHPASSRVMRSCNGLFRASPPSSADASNKSLLAKPFCCQGVILLGLKPLLTFAWALQNKEAAVIKLSVNFTAGVEV